MDTLFYRKPRLFTLAILMIATLGLAAVNAIGRQEDPAITNLFAIVLTPYPGADPERVEALVTEPLEAEIRGLPEVKQIRSTSRAGLSFIQVELSEFTPKDRIEGVWSELRDAIADPRLPQGAGAPRFDDDRVGAFTAIGALTGAAGREAPLAVLSRYADLLAERMRRLPGAKFVRVYGEAEEEILVRIDPDRLAAAGLSPGDVSAAIARADAKVSAGRVRGAETDFLIEVEGAIEDLSRLRRIPLAPALRAGGGVLRLGDLAEISRADKTPPDTAALADGAPAVLFAVRMEENLKVDRFMKGVRAELERFRDIAPDGVETTLLFDQSAYTESRLGELMGNLAIGVALVVAVLFLTMGWRAALVVALMLPLAGLLSLFVLERLGVVIHQMSVTGLIVALGLLVDGAIVMTDEIRRRLAAGVARLEAIGGAVRRLAAPLAASTVTTILAFMPMALLPGPAGDFVGAIATAVIVMLTASFALALTVTPALAGRLLPDPGRAPGRFAVFANGLSPRWLSRGFAAALRTSLRWRAVSIAAAVALPAVGFAAFPTLTAQFFPGVDRDQLYVQVDLGPGAAIGRTLETARAVDAILRGADDVEQVQWVIGESAPAFYYNMQADRDGDPAYAEALVTTASPDATARLAPALQARLDAAHPEAQIIVRSLVQGPPVGAPLEMRLTGPGLDTLRDLGEEARRRLSLLPYVTHTRAQLVSGGPTLVFELDEDKARLAGVTLAQVAEQLDGLMEGAVGGSLVEGGDQLAVRVRLDAEARGALARIETLRIARPGAPGAAPELGPPLSALGEARLEPADSLIARFNGERVNTVSAFLAPNVLPEEALSAFRAALEEEPLALPRGYRIEWGGDSDARNDVVNNLLGSMGLIVAMTVATIVLTFDSWRLSLIAFVVSGLSMGLSLLALELFQHPFGIQALIGVIGSIGVSINAAIIIMTALQADARAAAGDRDAIVAVVMGASRHIVSTTVTTFGGFLPLILAGGGFWPPFATAIAGGVLLSTVVSFFFVPQMFSLVAARGARPRGDAAPTAAAPA